MIAVDGVVMETGVVTGGGAGVVVPVANAEVAMAEAAAVSRSSFMTVGSREMHHASRTNAAWFVR